MSYDWNKFGRPRLALFNRVMAWFVTCMAVASLPFFVILALRDWTVIFAALMFTAAAVMMQVGLRVIYAADRPRPDYAAIARMEQEVYGEASEHGGKEPPKPARCYCNWCRGRAGAHGAEAQALYRAEASAALAQCDEHRSNLRWERPS